MSTIATSDVQFILPRLTKASDVSLCPSSRANSFLKSFSWKQTQGYHPERWPLPRSILLSSRRWLTRHRECQPFAERGQEMVVVDDRRPDVVSGRRPPSTRRTYDRIPWEVCHDTFLPACGSPPVTACATTHWSLERRYPMCLLWCDHSRNCRGAAFCPKWPHSPHNSPSYLTTCGCATSNQFDRWEQ
jgi:hypothetical protein